MSAGYDAHWRDPLASLQMRSSTYYRLAAKIKALADSLSGEPVLLTKEVPNRLDALMHSPNRGKFKARACEAVLLCMSLDLAKET